LVSRNDPGTTPGYVLLVSKKPIVTAVAWSAGALSLIGFAAAWVLAARNGDLFDFSAEFGPDRFMIGCAVAGTVLASRRAANPIGWFLLGLGLVEAARGLAGEYARQALTGPSHADAIWAVWFVNWSLILLFPAGLLTFLLLLFPDGRPLTRRWWAVSWFAAGTVVASLLIVWLDPGPIKLVDGLPSVPNPTAIRGWVHLSGGALGGTVWLLGWVAVLLAAASVVLRYRRSAGEERLQLKWFAWAVAVSLGLMASLIPVSFGGAGQVAYDVAIVAGFGLALPVAIGVSVLKYRLYAIDKIISRTVSYALVSGLVVGVYLGCVALLTRVLPVRGNVGVAVSVLAAAAVFSPLRRRLQGVVDRRFDRARYNAERVVTQYSVQLRDQVDLDVLGEGLLGVVDDVLAPAHLSLWMRDPGPFG
jgi:hypothetical protein